MTHLTLVLERLITYVSTLGGTILGPATFHGAETELATDSSDVLGNNASHSSGFLVLNADDWGRDANTTDRILECFLGGVLSSTSAMVFMEDSERAAGLARERDLETGLHVNLTSPFTADGASPRLQEHLLRVQRYLKGHRFAQVVYHPGLASSFQYVVKSQIEEYERLYGAGPKRLDGHHHMHLCANVLLGRLLPAGALVRPSFSFYAGEKGAGNRVYRALVNGLLARRNRSADYFFSLPPLEPAERIHRIFALAKTATVEVETHPVNPQEYRFLLGGGIQEFLKNVKIARGFVAQAAVGVARRSSTSGLACVLPYAVAFGAALYESLDQFSECL
ncbi:MAG: ChbG/HpnK family deacetylase [Acidobacteria bacterium]|nr:ChbG/HpnK family deacetylase [Acidobacteriota bacterium]